MKSILPVILLISFSICTDTLMHGQKTIRTFKGRVIDSATLQPMKDVSVCIYTSRDTSLVNFSFTTPNGNFSFGTTNKDSLTIVFSIFGYNEVSRMEKAVDGDWNFKNYGDIKLSVLPISFQLVTARSAAIRMKGDTMEINASRFKVLPGSDVAQLFKKIPGFEVNVKGEIKVSGVSVDKIMVDGSDFFGNNPGMVSKNLTADMIETVQVFEEKNEDGSPKSEPRKTINLKLKKGKRNGAFGDVLAGYGNHDRYEAGLRLNSFKNDRKLSFVANANNINETGFDFGFYNAHRALRDQGNGSDNGQFFFSSDNSNNSEGNINNKFQTGFTYFNEFSRKRKLSFNLETERNNYSSIDLSSTSNPLDDSTQRFNLDSSVTGGLAQTTSASVNYTQMKDSTLNIQTAVKTSFFRNSTSADKDNIILFNTTVIDKGVNDLKNNLSTNYFYVSGFIEKKYRKNIRYRYSLSSNYSTNNDDHQLYQYLKNTNDTFNNRTGQDVNKQEFLVKIMGQMPLSKYWNFTCTIDRWLQGNRNVQQTNGSNQIQNADFTGDYNTQIDTLSVDFNNRIEQYSVNPYISFSRNSLYFYIGNAFMNVDLKNRNYTTSEEISNHYVKNLPSARLSYSGKSFGYSSLSLQKTVKFPSSSDLLPVQNMSNNYMRMIGNKDLLPQETYSLRAYFSSYTIKGFKSMYLIYDAGFSDNAKIYINQIDKEGVVLQKPINETGKRDATLAIGLDKKLGKNFIQSTSVYNQMGRNPTYVNDQKAYSTNSNWYLNPNLSYVISDSFETSIGFNLATQNFKNNLNESSNYKQVTFGYNFSLRGILKTGTEINSEMSIRDQRNVPVIGKIVILWNLYVQQSIGKKGDFNAKLTVYDLLNQNTSIGRSSYNNYVIINQSNQLTQYFMFSLVYKIRKKQKEEGNFDYTY